MKLENKEQNVMVCDTYIGIYSTAQRLDESIANAKLIAAAPELLEACKMILTSHNCQTEEIKKVRIFQE